MEDFAQWVLDLVKKLWQPISDFLTDFLLATLAAFLHVVTSFIGALPGMDWASSGLQSFYGALPSGVAYTCDQLGVPVVLGMVGSAFVFRLGRKIVTLFQW